MRDLRKSAILYVIFMLLAQVVIGLLWWWKWDTMTTALCWTLYGSIGFVLATALCCFGFTPEEAEEDGGNTAFWILYFSFLLLWPATCFCFDLVLGFSCVVGASKHIASIVRKAAGVEE